MGLFEVYYFSKNYKATRLWVIITLATMLISPGITPKLIEFKGDPKRNHSVGMSSIENMVSFEETMVHLRKSWFRWGALPNIRGIIRAGILRESIK